MIVKNEAHLIVQTLKHLAKYIHFDYWVINDNGSTDGTQDLIRNYFKEAGIPGELDETPWQDFAFNRTVVFNVAFNKTDYAFVWDADDEIRGDFTLPANLTADSYSFTFGNDHGSRYSRCQLFNNRLHWKYVGVLHEYSACIDSAKSQETVKGDYFFISGRRGARSKDPEKYLKDAQILEKAFHEAYAANDPIFNRYAFYTAQSYNCCNQYEKSIEFYKKVLTLDNWHQEKYVSCIEIYDQYEKLQKEEEGLRFLVEAYKYDQKRVECAYRLIKYYCIKGQPEVSMAYYTLIQNYYENEYTNDNIATRLFAKKEEYDFYLPYYMIIVSERVKQYSIAHTMYTIIFRQAYLHAGRWWINNLFNNLQFCIPTENATFVELMLSYVEALQSRGTLLESNHYTILDKVITANRSALGASVPLPDLRSSKEPQSVRIMFTVTTCKRRDLFEQTVNSVMRTWKDVSSVDYFFCVDDNSSEEDRRFMKQQYPFFNYYMKSPSEKGHRESMNIIWNKLKELQPTYWVHMEDDWLFFKQDNFISRGIALLEKYEHQNIHQLVFNREYGLMLSDMERTSGCLLEPGVWLHTQKAVQGRNCAYWPHYSIQPSIVRTRVILELGNYDSANSFFERDYANKYAAAGYKTMFFNGIYSLHIGKQHWEKEGKNAYALNEVGQFANNPTLVISEIPTNKPLEGTMKEHLDQILEKITAGIPFGLIRPSDGEHKILTNSTLTNCDNWTFTAGGILQSQLMTAIQTEDPNLYVGIPCNTCNLPWNCTQEIYDDFIVKWKVPLAQRTYANIFMNANYSRFIEFLRSYEKGCFVVSSGTQESDLPIKERFLIDAKLVNRWDTDGVAETERLMRFIEGKQGQLLCFSAGPLSKVWIPQCMKHNPKNIYLDVGASLDTFTKGYTNRQYTSPTDRFAHSSCRFTTSVSVRNKKNLVYFSVFYNKDYFNLAKLLLKSLTLYSSQDAFDLLLLTSADFRKEAEELAKILPLQVHYLPCTSIFQAACSRLQIFDYPKIDQYQRILYVDTDILIKGDLTPLFDASLSDVLYGIESGSISSPSFGCQFFDFNTIDSAATGMNSGTLLFNNCGIIRDLFTEIRAHIDSFTDAPPYCMDQPFINYHAIRKCLYNNQWLKPYVSLYEDKEQVKNSETSLVCHFSFPIGNWAHKYYRMKSFFKDLLTRRDDNATLCISGKKYDWCNRGYISFLDNGKFTTTWGAGTYTIVSNNAVRVCWNKFDHVLFFNSSLDRYNGIRINPDDFDSIYGSVFL